jgi:hypothetical protein
MEMVLFAIAVVIITLLVMWVFISAVVFVWQEMNHNIKNLKRAVKQGLWDLEWKLKRR